MTPLRVLIADSVDPGCDEILKERGIDVDRRLGLGDDELAEIVAGYQGMIVRSAVKVRRPLIERMENMVVIGRAGAGVDNIDVDAATDHGILVMNTPGGNTISAAEHTVAMILSLARRIPGANASLKRGEWDRKTFVGSELMAKTVGVLGLGRIGREVALRLRPFDVRLIGYDPHLADEAVFELGVEPASFDEIVRRSDILTLHLPLADETLGVIGSAELAAMKPDAYLINCARGGIIDEAALADALDAGEIAGAALDVFESEPPVFPNRLIDHPRVVATPHIAASTEEAQRRVALAIAEQVADLLHGRGGYGLVNAVGIDEMFRAENRPMAAAAERLGELVRQLLGSEDLACAVHAYGEEAGVAVEGLGAVFLAGMLGSAERPVNAISAAAVADERRIRLETRGEGPHERYHFLLAVEVDGARGKRKAAVTLFGQREPRIVMIDDIWFDIRPDGYLLLLEHRDEPGTLAVIASILGAGGINIADLSLGRKSDSPQALTLIRIDSPADSTVMAHLAGIPQVECVLPIEFPPMA